MDNQENKLQESEQNADVQKTGNWQSVEQTTEPIVAENETAENTEQDEARNSRRRMLSGLLWCVGGLAITSASYWFADAGGKFSVFYGAVIYGIYDFLVGLVGWLRYLKNNGMTSAFRTWLAAGIVGIVVVAGLTYGSYRLINGGMEEGEELLDREQVCMLPQFDFKIKLPAGMTECERTFEAETDTTYMQYRVISYNNDIAVSLAAQKNSLGRELVSADELFDCFGPLDSLYFDNGIIVPSRVVTLGGHPYLKTIGHTSSVDGCVVTLYDFTDGTDTASLYYLYDGNEFDAERDAAADRFIEECMIFCKAAGSDGK